MENWDILRERLTEQIEDCRKHVGSSGSWNVLTRAYNAVLDEMERIENGTYADYKIMKKMEDKNTMRDFVGRLINKVQCAHFGNKRQWLKRLLTKILLDIYSVL